MARRTTGNGGINPRDLLIYKNSAESLNLDPKHSFEAEVDARSHFIHDCESFPSTTDATPQSFKTPSAIFYKRYVIVKDLKESRNEHDFPPGGYTTPSAAAKEIRKILLHTLLPVTCFVGEELVIGKKSYRHCWAVIFWRDGSKMECVVKDSVDHPQAKVPMHVREMAAILGITSVSLIPATNEDRCSTRDCVQLTYNGIYISIFTYNSPLSLMVSHLST